MRTEKIISLLLTSTKAYCKAEDGNFYFYPSPEDGFFFIAWDADSAITFAYALTLAKKSYKTVTPVLQDAIEATLRLLEKHSLDGDLQAWQMVRQDLLAFRELLVAVS